MFDWVMKRPVICLTLKYGYDISTMQMQSKSITLKMKIITIEMSFKIGSELVSSA